MHICAKLQWHICAIKGDMGNCTWAYPNSRQAMDHHYSDTAGCCNVLEF